MLKLNASWTKVLKTLHIFCAMLWAGGATGILLLIQCVILKAARACPSMPKP